MQDSKAGRVTPLTDEQKIAVLAMAVYSIPPVHDERAAVVVFPGLGEKNRLIEAARVFRESSARLFLYPGVNLSEKMAEVVTATELFSFPYNFPSAAMKGNRVIMRSHAEDTKDQTDWIADKLAQSAAPMCALVAPQYHCLRAYLTLLKSCMKRGIDRQCMLLPIPVRNSPESIVPEIGVSGWDMMPGEINRILKYQEKGDAATFDEAVSYINWLWTVPSRRIPIT